MRKTPIPIYAHSLPDRPVSEWELLEKHACQVAERAGRLAAPFGGQTPASLLGLVHDLGKLKPRFQAKLHGEANDEPHSAEGAWLLQDRFRGIGLLLAACVAGHHSGLPDIADLIHRLRATRPLDPPAWMDLPDAIGPFGPLWGEPAPFSIQFATRMLFSCLVDADELETSAFHDAAAGRRVARAPDVVCKRHRAAFDTHMARFEGRDGPVNGLRADVLSAVRAGAAQCPGLFTLTVPTGGGKTLASLGFALDHALTHGMERIVHVIPYTSIVEQTADVFRGALGVDAVVEHHSTFDWDQVDDDETLRRLRRVTRNWDAPVVVTTAVQFFESLFAARKRRCAKLHNLARAVIVIDEAQAMPRRLLRPCLAAIRELADHYGSTVVLSTATQPALTSAKGLDVPEALEDIVELAPEPPALYRRLRRVRVTAAGLLEDEALAARIAEAPRILTIVDNRRHARSLFDRVAAEPGAAHLSTSMTSEHRRQVLAKVRARLTDGLPVRLVSTSLIEAGVDVSFPVVMRAATGLDSVAQAAGRCNREGELGDRLGEVVVFDPVSDSARPPEEVRHMADIARTVIATHPDDPLSSDAVEAYFRKFLWSVGPEALDDAMVEKDGVSMRGILREIAGTGSGLAFRFDAIAHAFRMIDDGQHPVIVRGGRWGIPDGLLSDLEWRDGPGGIAKTLQPFTVSVPRHIRRDLESHRAASLWREDLFGREFLLLDHQELYDDRAGLRMERVDEGGWIT